MHTARFLLAAVVTAMLLGSVGCRSSQKASGLTTVKLQADWYPQPEQGGFYDAIVKGFYKDEGLDVQILPGGPYISSEPLVASGAVQFGMNTSDHVLESIANSNEPIIAVGATMQHDPQGILVRADSPVHTWTDLNGRTVAVKPGSTWWEFLVRSFTSIASMKYRRHTASPIFCKIRTTSSSVLLLPSRTLRSVPAFPRACS